MKWSEGIFLNRQRRHLSGSLLPLLSVALLPATVQAQSADSSLPVVEVPPWLLTAAVVAGAALILLLVGLLIRCRRHAAELSLFRFEKILSATGDPMVYVDSNYIYREVNDAYCAFFKKQRSELIGHSVRQVAGEKIFTEFVKPYLDQCLRGQELQVENWLKLGGAGRHYIKFSFLPVPDRGGNIKGALVTFHDMTEMKFALDSLAQSEEKFRSLVEASSDWIWEINQDGVYIYSSPRVKNMLGYEPDELLGKTPFDLMAPDEAERVRALYLDHMEQKRPIWNLVNIARHKQGHDVVLETNGIPVLDNQGRLQGYRGVDRDITIRSQAQQSLRHERDLVTRIMDTSPAGVVLLDPNGQITFANEQAQTILGLDVDQVTSRTFDDSAWKITDFEGRPLEPEALPFARVMATRQTVFEVHHAIVKPGGERVLLSVNASPIVNADGQLESVVAIIDNITDRVKTEQEIRRREAELASLFRALPVGIGILTHCILQRVNERLCEMTGYSQEELIGQSARIFYPTQEDFEYVGREKYRQIREQGTGTVETRWRRKDGGIIDVLLSSTPLDTRDLNKGVTFTALDITDRKIAEERYRSISEAAPMGLMTFALEREELIFTGFNPAAAACSPVPLDPFINKPVVQIFTLLTSTPIPDGFVRLCREGGIWKEEQFTLMIEGHEAVFEFAAFQTSPGRIAVLFSDITERIRTRRALQESQRAMTTLIGNLPGIVYRCANQPQWPMEFISKGCLDLTGYTDAQFLAHRPDWNELIVEEDRPRVWEVIQQAADGGENFQMEYRITAADGAVKWMWERGCAVYDENDRVTALEGFITDYTSLKKAQDRLAQRLHMEQFVAGLSHAFVNLPTEQIDEEIDRVLRRITDEFPFERIRLAEMAEDQSRIRMTRHLYCKIEDSGPIDCENLDRDFPFIASAIRKREVAGYCDLPGSLPPEAAAERDHCLRYGIKSFLVIPMFVGDNHVGALFLQSVQNVEFDADLVNYLKFIAELLVNVILRQRNARAIAESQQRFQSMAESSPMGILMYELTGSDRLILTHLNPAAERILNMNLHDCINKPLEEIFPLLADTEVPRRYRRLCREGGAWTVSQFKYANGDRRGPYTFHAFQTSPGRIAVFFEDIHERLRQQEALQLTQFAVDHVGEAVYWMAEDGSFLYINEAASRMLGYSRDELLGMTVFEIDPELTPEVWKEIWKQSYQQTINRMESRHRTREGRIIPVEITGTRFKHEGQDMSFAFVRDISDRKAQEAAREKLLKELQVKNEELESIVFIASHDLRSPLVNIEGFTGELKKACAEISELLGRESLDRPARERLEYILSQDIPESLHFITTGTSKMDSLLSGLLRLSRIGTATFNIRPIDMNHLMKSILSTLRYQIREDSVQIDLEDLPPCLGDAVQINQVFTNLIDNAMKYRDPGRPCRIRITGRTEADRAVYTVQDNGIGIAPQHTDKIFEIFHQLNPGGPKRGEGLGLTIVRRILDRQDGKIWVESQPDQGASFHVALPAVP